MDPGHLTTRTVPVIPVVVHVVWKDKQENVSDERIFSQLEALNRDFGGRNVDLVRLPAAFSAFRATQEIRFCLATRAPDGRPSSGVQRRHTDIPGIGLREELFHSDLGGLDAWDTKKYLNIWVADTGDDITGYGIYPEFADTVRDGIVVNAKYFGLEAGAGPYDLGRVAVHEAGHYLGLSHPWGDAENCQSDDGVEDTPLQRSPYHGCPAYPQFSCGQSNMFMNFMDYVDDACMVFFTEGQMNVMLDVLEHYRSGLLGNDDVCTGEVLPELLDFRIFPNPTASSITIEALDPLAHFPDIAVYDAVGRRVRRIGAAGQHIVVIDMTGLPQGVYFIRVGSASKSFVLLR